MSSLVNKIGTADEAAPLEALRARASAWTGPISADTPAGRSTRQEPDYERIVNEVSKLESPAGGDVSWGEVVERAGALLCKDSKDLRIAAYFAYGLFATQGLGGAATGMTVMGELLERYWPTLFPEADRARARVNAVAWLVERLARTLPGAKASGVSPADVAALSASSRWFSEVARARFAASTPAFTRLLEGVEQLRAVLPAPKPAPAPAPPPKAAPSTSPAPETPPAVVSLATVPPALASADGAAEFLRGMGTALLNAAAVLRKASGMDPRAYELSRTGLWLHLRALPAAGAEGRTPVPPLRPGLREQLEKLAANARWAELLDETEAALEQHRLALDLQRFSARAMSGLGESYAPARAAVIRELAALLKRLPGVAELLAADGSPLADAQTRAWIDAEVLPRSVPAPAQVPQATARQPVSGAADVSDALARFQQATGAATTARRQFEARLALAGACATAGQLPLARTLYEELDREAQARGLDTWDPPLAAACLEGLLSTSHRAPAEGIAADPWSLYRRLSLIDPAAALRAGAPDVSRSTGPARAGAASNPP